MRLPHFPFHFRRYVRGCSTCEAQMVGYVALAAAMARVIDAAPQMAPYESKTQSGSYSSTARPVAPKAGNPQ